MKSLVRVATLGLMLATTLALASCNRKEPEVVTTAPTVTETPSPSSPAPSPSTPTTNPAAPAPPASPRPAAGETAINPPKSATLTAQQAEAQINLRSQPNTGAKSKGYGLVGDGVKLLKVAEGSDQFTWYYVKFDSSGAEGWIRGDFINTSGQPVAAARQSAQASSLVCEGVFEGTVFTARYTNNGFSRIDFKNLESKATFGGPLRSQGANGQGQPVYSAEVSPPAGGSYPARLTDLSGGNPSVGSQVALEYAGITGITGECQ